MAAGVSPFTKPQLPCLLLAEPSWDPFTLCPEETPSSHQQPLSWQCRSFQAVGSHWSPWLFVCCPDTCCPGLLGVGRGLRGWESLPQSALPAKLGKSFKDSPSHFAAPEIETQDKVANPPSFRLRRERETPLLGRSEGPERRRARWKIGGWETGADRTRYPSASGLAKVEVSSTVFVLEIRGSFSCRARPLPALSLRGRGRGSPASATLQPTPPPGIAPGSQATSSRVLPNQGSRPHKRTRAGERGRRLWRTRAPRLPPPLPWLRSGCRTGPPGCARSLSCCTGGGAAAAAAEGWRATGSGGSGGRGAIGGGGRALPAGFIGGACCTRAGR